MTIVTTREQRRQLARDNAKRPIALLTVPVDQWPDCSHLTNRPIAVWRSRFFLVQEFDERDDIMGHKVKRLTVSRTELGGDGRWVAEITWDELQRIKQECGFGNHYAIEVFPRDRDVVNVANMRHLWVLSTPLDIGWFK